MIERQPLHSTDQIISNKEKRSQPLYRVGNRHWITIIGVLLLLSTFYYFGKQIHKLEKKQKEARHSLRKLKHGVIVNGPLMGGLTVPMPLRNIPFAETEGIVVATRTISIRNVFAPHNACIIKNEKAPGYHLIFRYDQFCSTSFPSLFSTYLGIADLDENFEQTSQEFQRIDTQSEYSEDPRVVKLGKEYYLCYNDKQPHSPYCRSMRVSQLSLEDRCIKYTTNLDLHLQHVEKNWPPFEYLKVGDGPQLMFEYSLSPHHILEISDPRVNAVNHLIFPDHPSPPRLPWQEIWGHPRGGTPSLKIDNDYLGFFHSCFKDSENILWYVFGAYTFETEAPFRITSVSKCPILFEGIYDTPILNTAPHNKRVIFPSGFVIEEQDGKQLIQLSCGENDSSIKVITIDKEALYKNMIKCDLPNTISTQGRYP